MHQVKEGDKNLKDKIESLDSSLTKLGEEVKSAKARNCKRPASSLLNMWAEYTIAYGLPATVPHAGSKFCPDVI